MSRLPLKEICSLVERTQSGEEEAFTRLYEATAKAQFFTAFSILRDRPLAEDAIQIIYLKVYKDIGTLTRPEYFLSWLSRITYHTCLNILKSRKHISNETDDAVLMELPDVRPCVNPLHTVITQENREYLLKLLDGLSVENRAILIMRYYQGLKVREIAHIMKLSEGTVKSRIHYALRNLADTLKANGYRGPDTLLGAGFFLRSSFQNAPREAQCSTCRRKERLWGGLMILAVSAVTAAVLLGAARFLPIPELRSVEADTAYTNDDVNIKIRASVQNASQLQAAYENGEALPVVQISAQQFYAKAGRNGKVIVSAGNGKKVLDKKTLDIKNIDYEKPVLRKYEYRKGRMHIFLVDDLSGIDADEIAVSINNNLLNNKNVEYRDEYMTFPCKPGDYAKITVTDKAGNSASFELEALERVSGASFRQSEHLPSGHSDFCAMISLQSHFVVSLSPY